MRLPVGVPDGHVLWNAPGVYNHTMCGSSLKKIMGWTRAYFD